MKKIKETEEEVGHTKRRKPAGRTSEVHHIAPISHDETKTARSSKKRVSEPGLPFDEAG